MRALITGASGFIGSHLAERLEVQGHKIRCLVRDTSDTSFLDKLKCDIVKGLITDGHTVSSCVKDVDVVYHTAGAVGEWLTRDEARFTNIEGTRLLVESALKAGVKRFVHVSSLAVLGMHNHQNTPADAPYKMTGDTYSDTKIDSERLVLKYCSERGLPAVVVRPGYVFGPRDRRFLPRMVKLLKEGKFVFLGKGNNIMNLVYIDNLIDVLTEAGTRRDVIGKTFNVTNKDKVTMKDFAYMVCDILSLDRPTKSIPFTLAKTLATTLEISGRLLGRKDPPFLTKARVKVGGLNLDFDISGTIAELDYESRVSIREGLEKTLKV